MKNLSKIKVLVLSLNMGLTSIVSAQLRSIDIEAINESPSGNIEANDTLYLKASIRNNGPDNLIIGDTLFYTPVFITSLPPNNFNTLELGVRMLVLKESINAGTTVSVIDEVHPGVSVTYTGPNDTFSLAMFCIKFLDPSTSEISIGGNSVAVSYKDPNISNNNDCDTVRVYAPGSAPTAINDQPLIGNRPFLFPNPTSESVYIDLQSFRGKVIKLKVVDLQGRVVLLEKNINEQILDLQNLTKGVYIVEAYTSYGISYNKLIITK